MSEYWKSTPKYWCKHCQTFVRDTKLEKTNHEATAKHQGNIKRFLRDLHRGHEREERQKDRAKSEVERLNGVVSGTPTAAKAGAPWTKQTAIPSGSNTREATPAERKAQLAKLAEMGVAVPEDFRREMAMAGDWQTLAQRPVGDQVKKEEGLDDFKDFKPDPTLNIGVRKRKHDGEEEEEAVEPVVRRKGWGSTVRQYPGSAADGKDDLDALLTGNAAPKQEEQAIETETSLLSPKAESPQTSNGLQPTATSSKPPPLKKEESSSVDLNNLQTQESNGDVAVKQEDDAPQPAVVFKKRKAKNPGKA
ncbi:MAG: hypothetical protein Q9218_006006 [Villophora microphyllina]